MQSIRIERYGGPEVILHCDIAVPTPKSDEVFVRLAYSGINFMDVHTRMGVLPTRYATRLMAQGSTSYSC